MAKTLSQRDSAVFSSEERTKTRAHTKSLLHVVTAAQKLPELSLPLQHFFMLITLLQLLCAGAAILGRAAGRNSPGLTIAARIMAFIAPIRADTEINPTVYYFLFLFSVLLSILSVLTVSWVSAAGTSLAR